MNSPIVFNGINGATGEYLLSADQDQLIAEIEQGQAQDSRQLEYLRRRASQATMGVREGIDPKDLAQAGWGIVFEGGDSTATDGLREALKPLLDLRREQAAAIKETLYREYLGEDGWRPDETARQFLQRQRVGSGSADPAQMPYYLALVGPPDALQFQVQFQLDIQRAIGRIAFASLDDYAAYAEAVACAERAPPRAAPRLSFFGPANRDDRATALSSRELLAPLADSFAGNEAGWPVDSIVGAEATKARLSALLGAAEGGRILFTASHGMAFPAGDPRQLAYQGALLCQDWPGPRDHRGPIPGDFYFSADDLGTDADVRNLIAIHFACFSAGTPRHDDFAPFAAERKELAGAAFLAGLPQRLLAKGALAVLGHVERAWGCSFFGAGIGRQIGTFEDVLKRLMNGHPIGSAVEPMNQRYAELSSLLGEEQEARRFGEKGDDAALISIWTECNDARNYVILGDPAVRLPMS